MSQIATRGESARRRSRPTPWLLTICAVATALGACERLLDVELPGEITEADLFAPENALIMVNGAIGTFECAANRFAALDGAGFADNWDRMGPSRIGQSEYRLQAHDGNSCTDREPRWFGGLQMARKEAEVAYQHLSGWSDAQVPNREQHLALMAAYAGYVYQMLGEVFCELTFDGSAAVTPVQAETMAETWFTNALEHVTTAGDFSNAATTSVRQMILLGRARARFAKGDLPGAAADAALIQPGFVVNITRGDQTATRYNEVYETFGSGTTGHSVAPAKRWPLPDPNAQIMPFTGYQNLSIDSEGRSNIDGMPVMLPTGVRDTRVDTYATGQFSPSGQAIWKTRKFPARTSPMPLARWAEAQLILAEIEGGTSAIDRVNAIRAARSLPLYTYATPTTDDIMDLILEEKRREFFFEGRFWADKLRHDLWFPEGEGQSPAGFAYFEGTCMYLPQSEYNTNPNVEFSF